MHFTKEKGHYYLNDRGNKEKIVATDKIHNRDSILVVTTRRIVEVPVSTVKKPVLASKERDVSAEALLKHCPVYSSVFRRWIEKSALMDDTSFNYFVLLLPHGYHHDLSVRSINNNVYRITQGNNHFYAFEDGNVVKIFSQEDIKIANKVSSAVESHKINHRKHIDKFMQDMGGR
jgi:hypothetical protein